MARTHGLIGVVVGWVVLAATAQALTPTPTPGTRCTPVATPALHFEFVLEPARPVVGDAVTLRIVVRNDGALAGLPDYQLSDRGPVLEGGFPPLTTGQSSLGSETVTYSLRAVEAGTVQVALTVRYERAFGCAGDVYFGFDLTTSPPFAIAVEVPTPTPSPTPTVTPTPSPPGDCDSGCQVGQTAPGGSLHPLASILLSALLALGRARPRR